MKDEIKIGEYIRFKNGIIAQIINKDEDNYIILNIPFEGKTWLTDIDEKEKIKNHDRDIINIVEIDDIVNGFRVVEKDNLNGIIKVLCYYPETYLGFIELKNKDIQSVLTYEQYAKSCYNIYSK